MSFANHERSQPLKSRNPQTAGRRSAHGGVRPSQANALISLTLRCEGVSGQPLTNSHHGGVAGQAPQIKLASEVQGVLPYANMSPVRATLTANLNLYVATNGSDTNDGLTSQTPFATLQKAWNTVIEQYDLGGHSVTINVESGTYTAGVACISNPIGAITGINNVPGQSGPSVIFLGNTTTPDSVVIDVTGNNCFQATNGAQFKSMDLGW